MLRRFSFMDNNEMKILPCLTDGFPVKSNRGQKLSAGRKEVKPRSRLH